jgi:acyl carrier protein
MSEYHKKIETDEKLFLKVQKIISEQLGIDDGEIHRESKFVDDLGADSLDTVELVMKLEEVFDIQISDADAETVRTVQDALNYLMAHKVTFREKVR